MARPLEIGLLLRQGEQRGADLGRVVGWSELRDCAQAAEGVGFDTIWVADHTLMRNAGSVVLPEDVTVGVFEAFTLLGSLAEATRSVTLGPFVACTSFRNPALLAKIADTLDEVSGGRLLLGLGAGWHQPEYDAFGYPFDHLASRFDEALQVIVPLLRTGHVDFNGEYYQAANCELRPRGPRGGDIPIWIGAARPRMLRLVARYANAYNSVWHASPNDLQAPYAALDAACEDVGRNPQEIRRTAGTFAVAPGFDAPGAPPTAQRGSVEELAGKLAAFAGAGATHLTLILDPWTVDAVKAMEPVIRSVRARLAS
ncbi:MAG: LLM class flavin-dependent oxidoreductase [Chloroflexota bacterium]